MKRGLAATAVVSLIATGAAWAQQAPATHLTEPQARSALTSFGCANVSHLSMGPHGSWYGNCTKGGQQVQVRVDPEGKAMVAKPEEMPVTAAHARAALMQYGCSNVSGLSRGPEGTWHGQCTKGGQTVDVMVDQQGKASTGKMGHYSEAHARSALTQYGCSNISSLSSDTNGNWSGQCSKGGRTINVMVDPNGTIATK